MPDVAVASLQFWHLHYLTDRKHCFRFKRVSRLEYIMNKSAVTALFSYVRHCHHRKVTQEWICISEAPDETRSLYLVFMFVHCHCYAVTESLAHNTHRPFDKAVPFIIGNVLIAFTLMNKLVHVESSVPRELSTEISGKFSRLSWRKDISGYA